MNPSSSGFGLAAVDRRDAVLHEMDGREFDVVVIGGGITGAGLAREAAHSGLSVLLLDAGDFACGTSSRSTKLIHGGLRYLALGDVRLVREAARERKTIHRIAPHLAEPLWMLLPARSYAEWVQWRAGISLYERLGQVDRDEHHRNWKRAEIAVEEPALSKAFKYVTAYREYRTDDVRLVLANLRSAASAGACALNHASVFRIQELGSRCMTVDARCSLLRVDFRVLGRCVVNAAGPWVEAVRRLIRPDAPPWLQLTRGIHVTLPRERLPIRNMTMLRAADGRLMFAIPRSSIVYVGTTDTTHQGAPETWPPIPRSDIEYLLEALPRHFDIEAIDPEEVLAAWAGLRPLIAQSGRRPSDVSRRDELEIGPPRLISIAGGKLTAYRLMARAVLEKVSQVLGKRIVPKLEHEPLPGGDFDSDLSVLARDVGSRMQVTPEVAERMVRLYGTEAYAILRLGSEQLGPDVPVVQGEIDWAVSREGAATLEDVFYRRTRVGVYEPFADRWIEAMAFKMAKLLSWTSEQVRCEIDLVRQRLARDLAFRIPENRAARATE